MDLGLGFSKMSTWASYWRLSEVLGICVFNLIMHPWKSRCDLYRSSGFCIPLKKTAFHRSLLLFPFCKMGVAVLPPLGEEWEGEVLWCPGCRCCRDEHDARQHVPLIISSCSLSILSGPPQRELCSTGADEGLGRVKGCCSPKTPFSKVCNAQTNQTQVTGCF